MKITGINPQSFHGTVTYDKKKVAREIAKLVKANPEWQMKCLIDNFNKLKKTLESETSDYASFYIDLDVNMQKVPPYEEDNKISPPITVFAKSYKVTIRNLDHDDYHFCADDNSLAVYDKKTHDVYSLASHEGIYQDGFERITKAAIADANKETDINKCAAKIFDQLA